MKLEVGKFYKVSFENTMYGFESDFIGVYEGIVDDEMTLSGTECMCCGKENHKQLHQFNYSYYPGTIAEMTEQLDKCQYQTEYVGTACINNHCHIEEYKDEV